MHNMFPMTSRHLMCGHAQEWHKQGQHLSRTLHVLKHVRIAGDEKSAATGCSPVDDVRFGMSLANAKVPGQPP